jgi:hypothetical protein
MVKNAFIVPYQHFGMILLKIVHIAQEVGLIISKIRNVYV